MHWKYVSLFGGVKGQKAENIEQRETLMKKVLGLAAVKDKRRDKEILDADMEIDGARPETGG